MERAASRFIMRFGLICLILVSLSPSVGWLGWWGPKTWKTETRELRLDADGLKSLLAKTHNGSIRAVGSGDVEEIEVRVTIKAGGSSARDAKRCFKAIDLVTDTRGSEQVLAWEWNRRKRAGWEANISFDITMPKGMELTARTHNGSVDLKDLASDVELRTHNGSIRVENHDGDLIARTHNGNIVVDQAEGFVNARTHNSSIAISAHEGDLKVSTHNGPIEVQSMASQVSLVTHNGDVRGDFEASSILDGIIKTYNGSIVLDLGDGASTRISFSTHKGDISVNDEFHVDRREKHSLLGSLGEGEGKLTVVAHNGSLRLR